MIYGFPFGYPLVVFFLSQKQFLPSGRSCSVSWEFGFSNCQIGAPWIWLERSMVYTPFAARILPTFISSRESSEFFFLLVIFESISESWEGGIFLSSLGPFLCPWSCLILLGIFPVSSGWHSTKIYLFIYFLIYCSTEIRSWQNCKLIFNSLTGFLFVCLFVFCILPWAKIKLGTQRERKTFWRQIYLNLEHRN